MSATLRITRGGLGVQLRRGTFDIELDGQSVGTLTSTEVPIETGHHTLRMTEGRYSSKELPFEIGEGSTASFHCYGTRIWPLYLASIVIPRLGIKLQPE
jgi:hypothetical protein